MAPESLKFGEEIVPMCEICGRLHTGPCREINKTVIKEQVDKKKILNESVCDTCGGAHKTGEHKEKEKMTFPDPNWTKDRRPGE